MRYGKDAVYKEFKKNVRNSSSQEERQAKACVRKKPAEEDLEALVDYWDGKWDDIGTKAAAGSSAK